MDKIESGQNDLYTQLWRNIQLFIRHLCNLELKQNSRRLNFWNKNWGWESCLVSVVYNQYKEIPELWQTEHNRLAQFLFWVLEKNSK